MNTYGKRSFAALAMVCLVATATGEIYVTDANNAAVRLTTNTFVDENPSFK